MSDPSDAVLTTSEAAAFLKTTQYTVWKWCKEGRLPAFQIGREWRIRKEKLYELIEELEGENSAPRPEPSASAEDERSKPDEGV